jgi:hypothetical protein
MYIYVMYIVNMLVLKIGVQIQTNNPPPSPPNSTKLIRELRTWTN